MLGTQAEAVVTFTSPNGDELRRKVRFIPLMESEQDVIGVLALAGDLLTSSCEGDTSACVVEAKFLHEHIQRLRHRFRQTYHIDRLLGDSAAMSRVRAQVAVAVGSSASVLVVGPPGSGREHVARAIQCGDPQRISEPLVPLACSLVGGELLRSTVAALLRREAGQSPRATLLLNDIDRLAPADQADLPSLLSAAAGRVRFLSTARTPLVELAQRGEFLTLAAHQLSTLSIVLPPLAERLSDLPLLAQLFLERANARGGKQVGSFSEESLDLLAAFPWTDDLDELEQVVIETHAACKGAEVSTADLPPGIRQARHAAAHPPRPESPIALEGFLGRIELELIQRALVQAKGNKTKAAQLLGLSRPRLYRRLVQLGLAEDAGETPEE